jgi:hypothetical protein
MNKKKVIGSDFQIPLPASGGGILKVCLEDGRRIQRKVLF